MQPTGMHSKSHTIKEIKKGITDFLLIKAGDLSNRNLCMFNKSFAQDLGLMHCCRMVGLGPQAAKKKKSEAGTRQVT